MPPLLQGLDECVHDAKGAVHQFLSHLDVEHLLAPDRHDSAMVRFQAPSGHSGPFNQWVRIFELLGHSDGVPRQALVLPLLQDYNGLRSDF